VRVNTHEVLAFIDVAIVSERFCQQLKMTTEQTLDYLAERGCRIGGVTHGERGLRWYDKRGRRSTLPALPIPARRIIDTSGAGDVFHGAYVHSYLGDSQKPWVEHFQFARAAAAYKVQRLGNEAGLPSRADVAEVQREFSQVTV